MNVKLILTRVRALVADPYGDWCVDELIFPLLGQAYEELHGSLSSIQSAFNEETIQLPGIEAGTTDLRELGAADQPLERLWEPRWLEWKRAGAVETDYQPVRGGDRVATVTDREDIASWEYSNGILFISPSTIAVDLRLRGMFLLPELLEEADTIKPIGLPYILIYKVASIVGLTRGNKFWAESYEAKAERGLDELESRYVKSTQDRVRRRGRSMRPTSPSRGWPRLQQ